MKPAEQKGITFVSFIMLLAMFAMLAFIAMRVFPLYLDAASIRSVLDGMEKKSFPSSSILAKQLDKNLGIQNVDRVSASDFKITEVAGEQFNVSADFQLVSPLIGDLSIQLKMQKQVKVSKSSSWQQN